MTLRPSASRLVLPTLERPPATVLEYLCFHFPNVPAEIWGLRLARGLVTWSTGGTLKADDGYRPGATIHYYREVLSEPAAPESHGILYRDDEILVADKPHGMPVTPSGSYVARSLLVRLQNEIGIYTLAPMHRLDRETAGVVLFSLKPSTRRHFHSLFSNRTIERGYLAVAGVPDGTESRQWRVENRIAPGTPWFRQRIVEGPPNAITSIELVETKRDRALFRLIAHTGKKHQLRVHMASLGLPILGDSLYPENRPASDADPPLQLLAHRLEFIDPLNGSVRCFKSERKLAGWE